MALFIRPIQRCKIGSGKTVEDLHGIFLSHFGVKSNIPLVALYFSDTILPEAREAGKSSTVHDVVY